MARLKKFFGFLLCYIEKIFDRSTKTIEHIESLPGKSGRSSEGWFEVVSAYRNEHNVFLLDAAYFIVTKQWSHPGLDLDEEYDGMVQLMNRVYKASKEFVQFASEGKISIWGRPNHKAPLQKIASEYWLNHELEYWSVWHGIKEEVQTEAINNGSQIIYTELKMSKAEVEKLWPVESF